MARKTSRIKIIAHGDSRGSNATGIFNPYEEEYFPSGSHLKKICCADEILVMSKERVFAIFDGISKLWDPSETARFARATLEDRIRNRNGADVKDFILNASNRMHKCVRNAGGPGEGVYERGTTFAMTVIDEDYLHIAHAGDSRIYALFSDSSLEQLTKDDYREGKVTKFLGAKKLELVLDGKHIIRDVDNLDEEYVSYKRIPLSQGGKSIKKVLLVTDGITNNVSYEHIKEILEEKNVIEAVEDLIYKASDNPSDEKINAYLKSHPNTLFGEAKEILASKDDISAIVVEIGYGDSAEEKKIEDSPEYKNLKEENKRLNDRISELEGKVEEYEKKTPTEPKKKEIKVIVADMDAELSLEAIARTARDKASDIKSKYSSYKVQCGEHEDGRLVSVSGEMSFGDFLSIEHGKIDYICSELKSAPQEYKTRCIDWCERQLYHTEKWETTSKRRGDIYNAEILKYKKSVEGLYLNLIRPDKNAR